MSDSPCSAKSLFYISALCLVQAAALSCSGLSCCATELWFVLSTCCGSAASQPIPGLFPGSGDGPGIVLAAAVLAPSHWWEHSCVSRQLSRLCHHSQRSWRETKSLNFTWPWNCACGQSVGLKPPLTLLSSQGSVVESWCSCCQ